MKHWNCSDTANVCRNCGFQTFSLPVYKRHTKHCAEDSTKVKDMNCELLNGGAKEPLSSSLGSKEVQEAINAGKTQGSGAKNILYCKHCPFSCNFSSQLITHIKKSHSSENKVVHDQTVGQTPAASEVNRDNCEGQVSNGLFTIKIEGEESNVRKEIVLKKIKLEIPDGDNGLGGMVRDRAMDTDSTPKTSVASSTSVIKADPDGDEKSRKCPECGFVAKNRDQMMSHRTVHVGGATVYSCNECEYKTHVRKNFERHEWCHIVDSPFKCLYCSFSSNGENAIKRHMSSYHVERGSPPREEKKPPAKGPEFGTKVTQGKKGKLESKVKPVMGTGTSNKSAVLANNAMVIRTAASTNPPPNLVLNYASMLTSSLLKPIKPKIEVQKDYVCPHCGLCYYERPLLEHHIKSSHGTTCFRISKGQLLQRDSPFKLEVSHPNDSVGLEACREPDVPFHSALKVSSKTETKLEEKSKVYKCGYCSLSFGDFGDLRDHMESDTCRPSTGAPSGSSVRLGEETVLQKLLTNDNPNKVYPKVPLISLITKSHSSLNSSSELRILGKGEEASRLLDVSRITVNGDGHVSATVQNLASSLAVCPSIDEQVKINKTYISCLLCVYKTLSVKVLRKHLVREHPTIICSKKILKEVVQKSVLMSSPKRDAADIARDLESPTQMSGQPELSMVGSSNIFLHMDVHCETENNPPSSVTEEEKKRVLDPGRFKPYECSECGKRSDWKHIIKKHITDKHENAKLIVLSQEEAEATFELYHRQLVDGLSPKMANRSYGPGESVADFVDSAGTSFGSEEGGDPSGLNLLSGSGLGMSDLLRLKRFKCSVCIYRSNFRCDISRHLKKRHPDVVDCHYSIMSIQEATETLPHYRYTWPEAEALLLASATVKEEPLEGRHLNGEVGKIDSVVERKATALVSRLPYCSDDGKQCHICPFVTNKAELLRLHMAYHQPQKRNCYSCPHCPFFVNTSRLLQHHIALHENDRFVKSVAAERTATQQLNAYNLEFNYVKRNPKFICEDCPYTSNNRNEFWKHRKGHFERGVVPSDLKCQHCPYWAEDRRDWHSHCSLHGGTQKGLVKKSADLAIGEFCRCDLADLKDFCDLACFRRLRCPCCSIRSPSVTYMRHHMLTHVAFTDAVRCKIFDRHLDEADDTLGNLCTRLLNMNYSLAEECRGEVVAAGRASAEDEETQMPVLEKVTEMPDDPMTSDLSVSVHLTPPVFAGKPGEAFSPDLFFCQSRVDFVRESGGDLQECYENEHVLAAPEEIVDSCRALPAGETACTEAEPTTEADDDALPESDEDRERSRPRVAEQRCPHAKTLFLLSLGIVPTALTTG